MMPEAPRYVVDASVATKWHLRDEELAELARQVLEHFREGRIALLAPDHIRYAVASGIRNALRTGRLLPEDGRSALVEFFGWRIPTVGTDNLIVGGYNQAIRFGCSLYDGLYLALAEMAQCPLIYADDKLRRALGNCFPLSLWIEDYRSLAKG